ncbi:MAG: inositol monophosphatase family protein [Gemmatimonadales bacterium]
MSGSPSLSSPDWLEAALELATLTGNEALRHFRQELAIEQKRDGSPVTIADRNAEAKAREWIERKFPSDTILGEEFGETTGSSGRTWLLDPIDGTRTFVHGVPLWGSLVAVVEQDRVLAGAAAFPAVQETIAASPGEGAWYNGSRSRVSGVSTLVEATVLTTDERGFSESAVQGWQRLASEARTVRTWGDCYGYLLVATGRAEVMVDARLNPWDAACWVPIIGEAGGVITDLAGQSTWTLTSAIATNAALAETARSFF